MSETSFSVGEIVAVLPVKAGVVWVSPYGNELVVVLPGYPAAAGARMRLLTEQVVAPTAGQPIALGDEVTLRPGKGRVIWVGPGRPEAGAGMAAAASTELILVMGPMDGLPELPSEKVLRIRLLPEHVEKIPTPTGETITGSGNAASGNAGTGT